MYDVAADEHPPHPFCCPPLCQRSGINRWHRQAPITLRPARRAGDDPLDHDDPTLTFGWEQCNEDPDDGQPEDQYPPRLKVDLGRETARLTVLMVEQVYALLGEQLRMVQGMPGTSTPRGGTDSGGPTTRG